MTQLSNSQKTTGDLSSISDRNNKEMPVKTKKNDEKVRESYSFTLAKVGLEAELIKYLNSKTYKGSGLTLSNYIRDIINKDMNGSLGNNHGGITNQLDQNTIFTINNIKNNIDSILNLLYSGGLVNNGVTNSMPMSPNNNANIEKMLLEISQKVNNSSNVNLEGALLTLSTKLDKLNNIENMLSNLSISNSSNSSDNSIDLLSKVAKTIETQNNKLDRLENTIEQMSNLINKQTEMIMNLSSGKTELTTNEDDADNYEDEQAEKDKITAMLNNDIGDDE